VKVANKTIKKCYSQEKIATLCNEALIVKQGERFSFRGKEYKRKLIFHDPELEHRKSYNTTLPININSING
jgi:hypothetical protein